MTSNAIRGIRRKKSSLSEVKIAVLGGPGVGKSALIVRFLTKRYIGEYDHQAGKSQLRIHLYSRGVLMYSVYVKVMC
ncbi:ras-like protein family member 11B [Penaeus monodon]|uniref:ras-like protein family member 11B n=1 Tax=Penaeus monodon TaxID=6687 RepID=UPI0018A70376|nr:ras-like protein family member 11B [Penaeus monodon]